MQQGSTVHSDQNAILESIDKVSKCKKYQFWLMLFLALNVHMMCVSIMVLPFIFENPTFKCLGEGTLLTEEQACPIISKCMIENTYTATSKLELYCSEQKINQRSFIQSAMGLGGIFGLLMINQLADWKGKVFCMAFSIFLMLLYSILFLLGILVQNVELIVISQFIQGYSAPSLFLIANLLSSKYLGEYNHYVVIFFNLFGFALSQITIGILNLLGLNWQFYTTLFVVFFSLSLIVLPFAIKQDPIFLFNNKEVQKLMNLIRQIGAFNGAEESLILQAQKVLIIENPQDTSPTPNKRVDLRLMLLIAIMASCSFTYNFVYFGISYSLDSLQLSATQSLLICGISEALSYIIAAMVMEHLPSIPTILKCSLVVSSVGFFFLYCEFVKNDFALKMIFLFVARFFLNIHGSFYITYYIENLPRCIEGTASGIIQSFGSAAKLVSPLLIRLSEDTHFDEMLMFSLTLIVSIFPLLLLKKATPPLKKIAQ